jgi:hypothetical protein
MGFINVIGGFLLTWAAIFFCWSTLTLRGLMKRIGGPSVNAIIIRRSPEPSMYYGSIEVQSPQNYTLTFRYEYRDKEYIETQVVSKNYYIQYLNSSVVNATCLPNRPGKVILAENYLYRKQEYAKARILFLLGILGLLLLVLEIYFVVVFKK